MPVSLGQGRLELATPYDTVTLDSVGSTQDEARARLGDRGTPLLVVAAGQTGGRGRSGRLWVDAPRALATSLAFRPTWRAEAWPRLPLIAGVAAAGALAAASGVEVALKWPNDVVHPATGSKLGGILTESSDGVVVAGLGVNLHWPDPPDGVASLLTADPGPDLAVTVATAWADLLLGRVERGPDAWGVDQYRRICVTVGADVTWEPDGAGRAVAVDPDGRLVVETAAGEVRLSAGEVRQVRTATVRRGGDPVAGGGEA
jgi:BirA family transcriptional regulator, biotin operon repressor / biotin---[acetyl-CoA-carboxylase] ligase